MARVGETEALRTASDLLTSWLGEPKPRLRRHDKATGADLVAAREKARLVVEFKAAGDAATVGKAIAHVKEFAHRAGKGAVPVVLVPYMGEVGRRLCAEGQVSWFDLSGNADITAPGVRILIDGRPNEFTKRGRPSSAFAPKSARIARHLLLDPTRVWRQHDLAKETGLDDGFTSRIVHRLDALGLTRRTKEGAVELVEPARLLDAWAEAYDFEKHTILHGHVTSHDGEELVAKLGRSLAQAGIRHAATGLAAAWLHAQFAAFRLVTFFVEQRPDAKVYREMGFREESKGANVWLVVPNDEGVFDGASAKNDIECVHPVQAYVDLLGQPERSKEAAAELRSQLLTWRRR